MGFFPKKKTPRVLSLPQPPTVAAILLEGDLQRHGLRSILQLWHFGFTTRRQDHSKGLERQEEPWMGLEGM